MGEGGAWTTKRGRRMAPAVRSAVVSVLANPAWDGLAQTALARRAGMSVRTLRDYMTPAVVAEAAQMRGQRLGHEDLLAVDKAMLEKARAGNVAAAKLIYARVAGMAVEDEEVPTLEEIERALAELKMNVSSQE